MSATCAMAEAAESGARRRATKAQPGHQGAGMGVPDLMRPSEVAALFRVDPKTVTKWAAAGKLAVIRTAGGHRRYKACDVLALLAPAAPSRPATRRPALNGPVPGLGPLESAIMNAVWDAGRPLTVRAARDRLDYRASDNGEGHDPAYTTIMTVMGILWRKGMLTRAMGARAGNRRAWWYEARVTREDHLAAVIRDALNCAPDPAAVLRRVSSAHVPASGVPRSAAPRAGGPEHPQHEPRRQ